MVEAGILLGKDERNKELRANSLAHPAAVMAD